VLLKILVVDDSRAVRKLIVSSLSRLDIAEFEFIEAEDGTDGLKVLDDGPVDLILLDWHMPRMGGSELVAEVRKRPETREIPIIMVTVESSVGKVVEAMDILGVDAFVSKPFTPAEMCARTEPLLQGVIARRLAPPPSRGFLGRLFNGLRGR